MIKKILQWIRQITYILGYKICKIFVKQEDKYILFLSDSRVDYSGNFKFVRDEIEKRGEYVINGLFKAKLKARRPFGDKFRLVCLMAKSKYIFLDDYYPLIYPLKLRKGTKLIQLWHAMGAFKTVGYSRMGKPGGPKEYSHTHRNYTGAIVSSESIRVNYADAFGIDIEKVHALGVPRTDIFFDDEYTKNIKESIYNDYPQLKNKKVILFAPTFRGGGQKSAHYDFDLIDFESLKNNFSDDYIFIIKNHPFVRNVPEYDFTNDDFYLDLSHNREINDLLFITDILITDYSSVIFEYSFFKKPVIFHVPDLEEYVTDRDFYYTFDEYNYGVQTATMEELENAIRDAKVDAEKINRFYDFFCSACYGKSAENVVEYFLNEE